MLFAIPNLQASVVSLLNNGPWETEQAPAEIYGRDKEQFRDWSMQSTTEHCFFTASEGVDPLLRVSEKNKNPVACLHGFIADYDYEILPKQFDSEYVFKKVKGEYAPNWISKTHSGNGRAVWLFEKPVRVANMEAAEAFLKKVAKELKVRKIWPSYDNASERPTQYYERGRDWTEVGQKLIPENLLNLWMFEACRDVTFHEDSDFNIPMDKIAERVEELYPNVWKGPFGLHTRGIAFWRPDATNHSSAVVRADGMQDFAGDEPFVPWSKLLGKAWVDQFKANQIGETIKRFWFDGRLFWDFDKDEDTVTSFPMNHMERRLRVDYNLNHRVPRGETHSQLDEVLNRIVDKRVAGVGPYVHFPPGPIRVDGNLYLNDCFCRPIEPAPKKEDGSKKKWGEGFEILAKILVSFFPQNKGTKRSALEAVLSWMRYGLVHAIAGKPKRSQVLINVGGPGTGKTFFCDGIIAPLLGGFGCAPARPFRFATGATSYNDDLLESPVWAIDDEHIESNKQHSRYTNFIKTAAAWNMHRMERKFHSATNVFWFGRVIVSMNRDGSSSRLLPDVDTSLLDKIMLVRFGGKDPYPFPPDLARIRDQELPHLARWLLDWEIPEHCIGDARFGIKTYHDPDLLRDAFEAGTNYSFFEILRLFLDNERCRDTNRTKDSWQGSSTELFSQIAESFPNLSRDFSSRSIGRCLQDLRSRGVGIKQHRTSTKRYWEIPFDLELACTDEVQDDSNVEIEPVSEEDLRRLDESGPSENQQ